MTKPVGEHFRGMLQDIAATPSATPAEEALESQDAWEARVAELEDESCMPARHRLTSPRRDGPWGDMLTRLESRLGTGFLVALIGPRGTGKTQMAVELIKATLRQGRPARFLTAIRLLDEIKQTYRPDARHGERQALDAMLRPRLLVIDEAGRRGGSVWADDLLFEVVNGRYERCRDTLLVGNANPDELQAMLGDSIVSRMNECGGEAVCDWPSFRP